MTDRALAFRPLTVAERNATLPTPKSSDGICILPVPVDAPQPRPHPTLGPSHARWHYRDAEGRLLFYVCRWDAPRRGDPDAKEFRCLTYWQGKGWDWKHPPEPRPLYGLDRLAQRPTDPVLICEGEKSADAAGVIFHGHVAVAWPGGANAIGKVDWQLVAQRVITIWPDNDTAGRACAERLLKLLQQAGVARVSVVTVPERWPDGWDLADDLPAGIAADNLKRLLEGAQPMPTASASDGWPEPEPLPALPDVAPFDFDLLPATLRPWIEDIAERVQCPPDFPAVAAMVALGAVVGRKIGIRPKRKDDWLELSNLWGCIIGRPGVMKSPALSEAMKPLRRLEVSALEAYATEHAAWDSHQQIAALKRQTAKQQALAKLRKGHEVASLGSDADHPEPQAKRYVVNDSSVEALGEILRANPNGALAYRDELVSLLKSLDREGNEGARGFYLTAWAGKEGYTFDRIGRGLNLRIDACCLSLLGSTQPAAIGSYLADAVATGGGDGLLSRFGMMVWPDISGAWRDVDRWPDNAAKNAAFAIFDRLDTLDGSAIGQTDEEDSLPFLRFDSDAQGIFNEWRTRFEDRLRSGDDHPAFESHLSKYRKLVPALALLSHLADDAGAAIGDVAVLKALGWVEYLETHARRAYAAVAASDTTVARALLRHILKGDVVDGFTERDVYKRDWSGLGRQDVTRAVNLLEDCHYLKSETPNPDREGGRPKTVWRINPRGMR